MKTSTTLLLLFSISVFTQCKKDKTPCDKNILKIVMPLTCLTNTILYVVAMAKPIKMPDMPPVMVV
jgi:hypothetical protein